MTKRFSHGHKEALYDLLWDEGLAGLAIVSKDGTFQKANPAFCKIVEYNELELQDMNFREITLPSDVDANVSLSKDVADGKSEGYDLFKGYITKTKKIVYVHLRVIPFKQDNEVYYLVGQVYPLPPDSASASDVTSVKSINKTKIDWLKVFSSVAVGAGIIGAFFVGIGHMIGLIN